MPCRIAQMSRPSSALAASASFLAEFEPFSSMPLKHVLATLTGAIERGHYAFAMEEGGGISGFGCFALAEPATVERILAGEGGLDSSLGRSGDVVVLLMAAARNAEATRLMFRRAAAEYPGKAWIQKRAGRARLTRGRFPARTPPAP